MNLAARKNLAYVVGIALGDGNLSNPNGRAIRLRITCDNKYPRLQREIVASLRKMLPNNRVSTIHRHQRFCDVSVYSNKFAEWLPWKVGSGSKVEQRARVPKWIFSRQMFVRECLRGLLQTDGSIYQDRGYLMVNFTNKTFELAKDVEKMVILLGYNPTFHPIRRDPVKYTVRIARESESFITKLQLAKD